MSVTNPIPVNRQAHDSPANCLALLHCLADQYPGDMVAGQHSEAERIAFNIALAFDSLPKRAAGELSIADLGGGVGMFSLGCAAVGAKRSVLIDDFNDAVNHRVGPAALDLHRHYGVEVVSRDVVAQGIADIPGSFDIVTSFDSMEHWHHSPKKLFGEMYRKLNPGGVFVLGVPNCVNLRKRMTALLGSNKWSSMDEWYEQPVFRGHVREPDVADLRYIARSIGLDVVRIYGRNWQGYMSSSPLMRAITRLLDAPMRLRPSLCSDLYLVARKPE